MQIFTARHNLSFIKSMALYRDTRSVDAKQGDEGYLGDSNCRKGAEKFPIARNDNQKLDLSQSRGI